MIAGVKDKHEKDKELKVQEVEISDQVTELSGGVQEWDKISTVADNECMDTNFEKWCAESISRISRWTVLRGG